MAEFVKKAVRKALTPTQAEIDFFDSALGMSDKKGKKTEKTEKSGCTMTEPGTSGTQQVPPGGSGAQQVPPVSPTTQPDTVNQAALVAAVAVKLPTFWADNPRTWFIHAESQFDISNVTVSRTKFNHIMASLPKETINTVVDIVEEIRTYDDPYEALKDRLLKGFKITRWARMSQIIHHPGLGDLRPSQLLDKMLALLSPGTAPGELFMGLFMEKMPPEIRNGVALKDYENPRDLAADADLLWDSKMAAQASGVHVVACRPDCMAAVHVRPKGNARRPQKQRTQGSEDTSASDLCYYHRNWGKEAHKCRQPCSWTGNAPAAPHN